MANQRSLPLCALASALLFSAVCFAQQAAPNVRIVNSIDENQLVTLKGTVHPLANARNDRGVAPDSMQLERMHVVLKRSASQEATLEQAISEMHTPGSPSYHKWLTPDQFGAQYGPSDQDITTVTTWLTGHGFSVTKVNPGKQTIEIAGNVAQLRSAFHTQIHKYEVNGETHYGNAGDPQIPAALAPLVGGFVSLNNFRVKSYVKPLGKASYDPGTDKAVPQWTIGSGAVATDYFALAPGDFSVQYDLNPLYSQGINGNGQTIAIVNDSNINIDLVNQFRSLFSLSVNPPQVIIDGNDPGVDGINDPDGPNYDSVEAYLDVEWSGAVAPAANVDLVIAADTALEEGLVLAAERAVYSNVAPVVSLSFGACESSLGTTNQFLSSLWEQAAAQGITVVVSTGDSGSAGCDSNSQDYATSGQAVNGFASTPYNIAVGGTDFYYTDYATGGASAANYWNVAPTNSTPTVSIIAAKAPIPEQPWNDSQFGLNIVNEYNTYGDTTIVGAGGGASNCALGTYDSSGNTVTCTGGYPKPSWQTAPGVPADKVRDLPDVSLFAANGSNLSYYAICATDGDCQPVQSGGTVQIYGVGGTSASAPTFAGFMALINQRFGPQGQADTVLYPLFAQFPASFHDISVGSNTVPCEFAPTVTTNCISAGAGAIDFDGVTEGQIGTGTTPEYNAGVGYDLATGLGTIDGNQFVLNWNKVKLNTTSTTMTAVPANSIPLTAIPHGTSVAINGTVTSGSGTPTGDVALMTDSTEPGQQGQTFFTLSNGAYTGTTSTLPGGTYNVWAQYGGDYTDGFSASTKTQITVTPETPGVNFNIFSPYSTTGYFTPSSTPGNSVDYGSQLVLSAEVAPTSQLANLQSCVISGNNCASVNYTEPTGTVTFTDSSAAIDTAVVNTEGDAEYNAPFAVGTHSVVANYNGDQSYSKVTSSPIAFTVIKDTPNLELYASATTSSNQGIDGAGQPLVFTVAILNGAQSNAASTAVYPVPVLPPTGTVTATGFPTGVNTSAILVAAVDPGNQGGTQAVEGVASFTVPAGTTSGTYNVSICYSGDLNYFPLSGSNCQPFTIPIVNTSSSGLQNSTVTATTSGSISPNSTITINGMVTGVSGKGAPGSPASTNPGYIYVYDSGYYINTIQVVPGSGITSSFSTTLSSQSLLQGSNLITLQYSGDNIYNASAFVLNSGNPISSPLSDFSLVPNTTIVPVTAGSNGTDTVNVASVNGFTGTVTLTCAATAPVTCAISPNPTLTSNGTSTSTLTVTAPSGTVNGNYKIVINGVDASTGEFVHTLAITAAVSGTANTTPGFTIANNGNITLIAGATTGNTSTIGITPTNGFTGPVDLSCTVSTTIANPTSPATCSIPSSLEVTGVGTVGVNVAVYTTPTTSAGTYTVQVTGTSGNISESTNVSVAVSVPSVTLSNSGTVSFAQGASSGNTATITVTPTNGFTGTVPLTCALTTQPAGATSVPTCVLNPTSVTINGATPETSTLTVSTTATTTTGAYAFTVTGTANGSPTTVVNVNVNSAAMGFTLGNSANISVSPGATSGNISTINIATTTGGFNSSITLTCAVTTSISNPSDPPTCSLSPASITPSQTSTLTITTTAASSSMNKPMNLFWPTSGGTVLALAFFFGIPKRRRNWLAMMGLLVFVVALAGIGCGGSGNGGGGGTNPTNPGTTAGNYTVTVTGVSGSIKTTTIVNLTVE